MNKFNENNLIEIVEVISELCSSIFKKNISSIVGKIDNYAFEEKNDSQELKESFQDFTSNFYYYKVLLYGYMSRFIKNKGIKDYDDDVFLKFSFFNKEVVGNLKKILNDNEVDDLSTYLLLLDYSKEIIFS